MLLGSIVKITSLWNSRLYNNLSFKPWRRTIKSVFSHLVFVVILDLSEGITNVIHVIEKVGFISGRIGSISSTKSNASNEFYAIAFTCEMHEY